MQLDFYAAEAAGIHPGQLKEIIENEKSIRRTFRGEASYGEAPS
jgi:hypothetical protein